MLLADSFVFLANASHVAAAAEKDPALAQQSQPVAVTPAPPCAPVQPQQITAEPQLQLQSPPPQQQQQQEETTQREEASHATQQEQQTINTTEQQPSIPPTLTALGITVPLHVFHQRSLEAAGANSRHDRGCTRCTILAGAS